MKTETLSALLVICVTAVWAHPDDDKKFSNTWVAEIHGGEHVARHVARTTSFTYKGPADGFDEHYVLKRDDVPVVSDKHSVHLTKSLTARTEVRWAEQQAYVKRSKRGFYKRKVVKKSIWRPLRKSKPIKFKWVVSRWSKTTWIKKKWSKNRKGRKSKSSKKSKKGKTGFPTSPAPPSSLRTYKGVTKNIGLLSNKTSAYKDMFIDPFWKYQWYSQDYRTKYGPVMDFNVVPVYKQGITGKNVLVAVIDNGVQDHLDLKGNFLPDKSYDMVLDKVGSEPGETDGEIDDHGTMCAGEIAMVANNSYCGVGIAHGSKLIGVRVLGDMSVEYTEARGLIYRLNEVDVYSNSWGPDDDGLTMEKIGHLTKKAFEKGVTKGRGGKGAIYVYAGGNGRNNTDNCAADSLVNNAHTIGIASVSQYGKIVYYSERCSAIFAGTYSGGNDDDEGVMSIYPGNYCTLAFSGTSAACPQASGIITLTLSANPNLTYRDVMHLITMSAEIAPVANNDKIWYKNAKGFWVSNDFGFGLLNAQNMVQLAKTWKTVPKKSLCNVKVKLSKPKKIKKGQRVEIKIHSNACHGTKNAVNFLEHLEVTSTIKYPYRGALNLAITSPSNTKTILLETRPYDNSTKGIHKWSIKSVHTWGEDPKGLWKVEVKVDALKNLDDTTGIIKEFMLTFHGTAEEPAHHRFLPRSYSAFRLPDGRTSIGP